MDYTYSDISKMIDHSLLNPSLTDREMEEGCRLAVRYDVASACVKPYFLKRCAELLASSSVQPSTVIGFPHGGHTTGVKVGEAGQAIRDGGTELDMVVNIGKVLTEDWAFVRDDILAVVETAHAGGGIVKVIFENCYLQDGHKIRLCEICAEVGADFVKTSTGFGPGSATPHAVALMVRTVGNVMGVKAAGGIKDYETAVRYLELGCTRLGVAATVDILEAAPDVHEVSPAAGVVSTDGTREASRVSA